MARRFIFINSGRCKRFLTGKPRNDALRSNRPPWAFCKERASMNCRSYGIFSPAICRLVGPRPLLPADQPDDLEVRRMVRPGLTGWAQVSGGKLISADEKNALDAWYIRYASLWLDLKLQYEQFGCCWLPEIAAMKRRSREHCSFILMARSSTCRIRPRRRRRLSIGLVKREERRSGALNSLWHSSRVRPRFGSITGLDICSIYKARRACSALTPPFRTSRQGPTRT